MTTLEKLEIAVKALDSKRAMEIRALDVEALTTLGDVFLIANGTSSTHVRTLADAVEEKLSEAGVKPFHREGRGNNSNWIVLDYGELIVHIFDKEARDFYQLERLWSDGGIPDISNWLKKD